MNFWINFWTVFFMVSVVLFTILAVVVTIGGFFDIRSLFRSLSAGAERSDDDRDDQGG